MLLRIPRPPWRCFCTRTLQARKEGYKTPVEREMDAMEKHVQQLRRMADEFRQKRSMLEQRSDQLKNDAAELEMNAEFADAVVNTMVRLMLLEVCR